MLNDDEKIEGITIWQWAGLYLFGLFCVALLHQWILSGWGGLWWSALIVAIVVRWVFIAGEESGRKMGEESGRKSAQKPKPDDPPQFNLPI